MSCARHLLICEGQSERAYLQRLQSFLDQQPLLDGSFEAPLRLIAPERALAKSGRFSALKKHYNDARRSNSRASIQIWADFDLYHRNDNRCAEQYLQKTSGIPDFLFSYHNFEDFFALHLNNADFQNWLDFGGRGHFEGPLHSEQYIPEFIRIFPGYKKGSFPTDFISWESLNNLKRNRSSRPSSNPQNLQGIGCFADFLVRQIDEAFPGSLD